MSTPARPAAPATRPRAPIKPVAQSRSESVLQPVRRDAPREVRIIGGQWKRSKLPVGDAPGLRPTPDRVRETLFNWLGQNLAGWRCLDAFAGSGALGFKAASRGAAEVVLIERERRLATALNAVKERLNATTLRVALVCSLAHRNAVAGHHFLGLADGEFTVVKDAGGQHRVSAADANAVAQMFECADAA